MDIEVAESVRLDPPVLLLSPVHAERRNAGDPAAGGGEVAASRLGGGVRRPVAHRRLPRGARGQGVVNDVEAAIAAARDARESFRSLPAATRLETCVRASEILENAWRAARALECGQVTINDAPAHGVGHFPFGGRTPDSGIGREGPGYSIDECTVLKTVVLPV